MKTIFVNSLTFLYLYFGYLSVVRCNYMIGAGIGDVTGPASNTPMMGYAKTGQDTKGIHLRQFSRAFIISNVDGTNPIVYVSVDVAMMSDVIKMEVVKQIKENHGDRYTDENILLSATHTHSGPGGYMTYILYSIGNMGFYKPSFDAVVDGIVESINKAHSNIQEGNIFVNSGELLHTNINRSPHAYEQNPEEERTRYKDNVDKEMVILKLTNTNNENLGMISWYPVHPVSMNNTNKMISSDNQGYAAILFEKEMNPDALPGQGSFISAFASSNLGDVSPNTKGPKCIDTGAECHIVTSACGNHVQNCIAFGPGDNMFESTKMIANNLFQSALSLYNSATVKLEGPVDFRQKYVDMTNVKLKLNSTTSVTTCKSAMGFSFAAGTTDGPGYFSFKQGDIHGNGFWRIIGHMIKKPSKELIECQKPKPILLATGEMTFPYAWSPSVVDFNVFRIGQLFIVSVPGEFTTMSGRRLKETIKKSLVAKGLPNDIIVVIAGLSNTYVSYITTYEEYQVQRYEGASTAFGPYTLDAMIMHLDEMSQAMAINETIDRGTPPEDLRPKTWDLNRGVSFDNSPPGTRIGDVMKQPLPVHKRGERVSVQFRSSNLRNSNQRTHTFFFVEKKVNDSWKVVATDANWETQLTWKHKHVLGYSYSTCIWDIPSDFDAGVYRIRYQGHAKNFWNKKLTPFEGISRSFHVILY